MSRLAVLMAANVLAVVSVSTGSVAAAPAAESVRAVKADCRNAGSAFDDRLIPGYCLRNGGYRFEMQYDGNLVLYSGSRACWASGTDGTDGVYAEFSGDWKLDSPWFSLESPYGRLRKYHGKYTGAHKTGNVSLNGKGEVWIAYGKFVSC